MIIFLYGSDGYRLKQNTKKVIDSYTKKYQSGLNLFELDLSEDGSIDTFEKAIKSVSFFNEFKLLIIRGIFSNKNIASKVAELIKVWDLADIKDIILLAVENQKESDIASKNKELFKALAQDKNMVKAFEPLAGSKLSNWIEEEFNSRDKTIDSGTITKLISLAGNDSWNLTNEIEKLANYATGMGQKNIKEKDVASLVYSKINLVIFDLIDAIAAKNKVLSMELLYKELKTDRDPHYILSMISYQFRNLMLMKSLNLKNLPIQSVISKSGLHPFAARKISNNLAKFSEDELKKIFGNLGDLDLRSKSGTIDLSDSLSKFILTLTA